MDHNQIREKLRQINQRMHALEYQRDHAGRNDFDKQERAEMNQLLFDGENLRLQLETPLSMEGFSFGERESASQGQVFRSFGEQLTSVIEAGSPNGRTDARLFQTRAASGLSEGIPSSGGFAVETQFSQELLTAAFDSGEIAKRCRMFPITVGNELSIPGIDQTSRSTGSRWGGVRSYWRDEAVSLTKSAPKFRKILLHPHKLTALCYLTQELMDDVPALESYVRQAFTEEFAFVLDDCVLEGTGSGMPLGIKNSGAIVEVAAEGGQSADTVVYQNILKMWARMIPSAMSSSIFVCNAAVLPQLGAMSLSVGSGGSAVYLPSTGAAGAPYGTLLGRPLIVHESAEALGDAGDIYLASFKKGYILGQRGGLKAETSVHLRFLFDELILKMQIRIDGSPMLSSSISPFKGSDEISHFVRLAAR